MASAAIAKLCEKNPTDCSIDDKFLDDQCNCTSVKICSGWEVEVKRATMTSDRKCGKPRRIECVVRHARQHIAFSLGMSIVRSIVVQGSLRDLPNTRLTNDRRDISLWFNAESKQWLLSQEKNDGEKHLLVWNASSISGIMLFVDQVDQNPFLLDTCIENSSSRIPFDMAAVEKNCQLEDTVRVSCFSTTVLQEVTTKDLILDILVPVLIVSSILIWAAWIMRNESETCTLQRAFDKHGYPIFR